MTLSPGANVIKRFPLVLHGNPLIYFHTTITPAFKHLPRTSTLSYFVTASVINEEGFFNIGTWSQCYKTFLLV